MKLTEKQIKQIIKEELSKVMNEMMGMEPPMDSFSGMTAGMGPDDPAYDAAGEVIMMTTRKFAHLAPMVKQGMGQMFENDIYHYVAEMCQDYGCEGHEDYITEKVMNMLKRM